MWANKGTGQQRCDGEGTTQQHDKGMGQRPNDIQVSIITPLPPSFFFTQETGPKCGNATPNKAANDIHEMTPNASTNPRPPKKQRPPATNNYDRPQANMKPQQQQQHHGYDMSLAHE